MPKPFKIEDSPLFQITLPGETKKTRKKSRTTTPPEPDKPEEITPSEKTKKQSTIPKEPPSQEQRPAEETSQSLHPGLYQTLLDKLVKHQTPTEHLVYSTLLKFSKIINDPSSPDNNIIITEPVSINKIARLCNITFKTAKRAIRNLINKNHISIFNPHNSQTQKPAEYKIEHNILSTPTPQKLGETWNQ